MILKKLVFSALSYAAQNPAVQKQAKHIAKNVATKAKPALLKGSRVAGKTYRKIKKEIKKGMDDYENEK
ncbi:MAG: hypothetical protein CM15mP117_02130 [Alphaproteobacteria bacterium]|nr:MAG: hypothetical protein CM15mP117_02130 [Alphaproteobacteria bacterium]